MHTITVSAEYLGQLLQAADASNLGAARIAELRQSNNTTDRLVSDGVDLVLNGHLGRVVAPRSPVAAQLNFLHHYVCGFLFNVRRDRVALISKLRPRWQSGLLNGVGGKVELGEEPLDAMRREFREEGTLDVSDWAPFCDLWVPRPSGHHDHALVHFFVAFHAGGEGEVVSRTDELVHWYNVRELDRHARVENLEWLVPLALAAPTVVAVLPESLSSEPVRRAL